MLVTLILFILATCRAIHEHAKWRNSPEWSVLHGTWLLKHDHPYLLDGYYLTGGIIVVGLFAAGMLWDYSAWLLPVAWVGFWQVHNLFYHVILTKKDKRDWRWCYDGHQGCVQTAGQCV